jgi:hypothetical protein
MDEIYFSHPQNHYPFQFISSMAIVKKTLKNKIFFLNFKVGTLSLKQMHLILQSFFWLKHDN